MIKQQVRMKPNSIHQSTNNISQGYDHKFHTTATSHFHYQLSKINTLVLHSSEEKK